MEISCLFQKAKTEKKVFSFRLEIVIYYFIVIKKQQLVQ